MIFSRHFFVYRLEVELCSDAELKLAVSRTIRVFDALSMHNGRRLSVYLEVAA